MLNILITGASGNVGMEVIKALIKNQYPLNLVAGVRDIKTDEQKLLGYKINFVRFDFTDPSTYPKAFQNCDVLFLLRPPHLSDVKKYFFPLVASAKKLAIKHIVFLSVQGVEKSKIIPHYKIEKLIVESAIPYTFLRPAYFMQNFTTTLHEDLVNKKKIFLPAGNAKFTVVDVRDIGNAAAIIISETNKHINACYELTCHEKLTFNEMANKLSDGLGVKITYESPNLLAFYLAKRKEKMPTMLIVVMMMLHYLPRFQKEPKITNWVKTITGDEPITFEQFVTDNSMLLIK